MQNNTVATVKIAVLVSLFLLPFATNAQQKKKIITQKTIQNIECTYCALEKKNPSCFIVQSYIGNVSLTASKKNGIKVSDDTDLTKSSDVKEYYCCAADNYTEITISANDYLSAVISLTPYDFKTGVPLIKIYDTETEPGDSPNKTLTVFEKMGELEKEESQTPLLMSSNESKKPKTAEKEIFMYKEFSKADCDYCLQTDKKARCFLIITSLKGAKLMDGDDRIPHVKALKMQDSTRQYIFCFRPEKYAQYLLKAKGYQAGVVEIIPNDFVNNQTPVLTFLNQEEKDIREGKNIPVNKLYTEKYSERWDCETCQNNTRKNVCLNIYSSLPDLLLNDEHEIISPQEVNQVGSVLKRYTFCISPNTRTLMVSSTGYEPSLLKLKFEDLETVGATTFIVSDDEYYFAEMKSLMEIDRTPVATPMPKSASKKEEGMEYRVQLIAKLINDSDPQKIQKEYNLSYEVKEDYDGKWYRFTVGSYTTYNDALKGLKEFNQKTKSSDAFIVLYVGGKRVGPYQPQK